MGWSIRELKGAREAIASLLDALDLDAYLFGVEPRDGQWKIQLEYADEDGWRTVELHVEEGDLDDCRRDQVVRRKVLASWQAQLAATQTGER